MIDLLKKIKQLYPRIKFRNPRRSDILLMHEECLNIMEMMVLTGLNYSILPASGEVIYVTPQILFHFIKNLVRYYLLDKKYRNPYLLYLLSCVEYIHPRIAITFIDNSAAFQVVSRLYKKAQFYAIQNGIKCVHDVTDSLPPPPHPGSVISLPHLICFGRHDIDLHKQYGHKIDEYHTLGSLIGGYFKSVVSPGRGGSSYDICLVSQWRRLIMSGEIFPEMKRAYEKMNEFVLKYIDERSRSLCIATCRADEREQQAEQEYYRKYFGDKAEIIKFDRLGFSTYHAMDGSRVTISVDSCAAWEAFGWGKKVLFCNFSSDRALDFPLAGPWAINEDNYKEFRQKLDELLEIEEEEYLKTAKPAMKYVMNYDPANPTHKQVRKILQEVK